MLVMVDGLEVEEKDRHHQVYLIPMLTTLARDHAPQLRQDLLLQLVHLSHQQEVNLSI